MLANAQFKSKMDAIESQSGRKSISLAEVLGNDPNCVPPPLSIGDKIIWLSDNGTEEGVVKWLGILPDVGKDWMAGVQFDNPVGSGTGLYNNQQLFIGRFDSWPSNFKWPKLVNYKLTGFSVLT